jgi:dGTPase
MENGRMKISDRIAYINHDIDDALRSGVIGGDELPEGPIRLFGREHGFRINNKIENVIEHSDETGEITMDREHYDSLMELRAFMFERVYNSEAVKKEEDARFIEEVITRLYEYYQAHPEEIPDEIRELIPECGIETAAKDVVAGMTDRYALNRYAALFGER